MYPPVGGDAAAGVLNEGAGHDIRTHLGGLQLLHELPVAVIHKHQDIGVCSLGGGDDLADLPDGQGLPDGIAPGTLDHQELGVFLPDCCLDAGDVGAEVFRHIHLAVFDTQLEHISGGISCDAQDAQEGVVGRAEGGDHQISRAQNAHEGAGDGMGAVHKLAADQARFRAEDLGENFIQGIPAQVIVAVAGGTHQVGGADPVLLKGQKHFLGIVLGHPVDLCKRFPTALLRLGGKLPGLF